jgi:hypothetical protein
MPRRVTILMDERIRFMHTYERHVFTFTELCAFLGISSRTGYKWIRRRNEDGKPGLEGRPCRPVLAENLVRGCSGESRLTQHDGSRGAIR